MSDLLIGRYALSVSADATVTGTTEDTDYPSAYLYDGNLARPAKLTGTTGNWVWDFGAAQRIDMIAFGPHNLTAALANVVFQGNATNSWGAPTLSATITIPSYREDGQSVNPFRDLTGVSGYTDTGFRYWRLNIGTASGAAVAIGEVALYSQKTTLRNFRVGSVEEERSPAVIHRTLYEVDTVYSLGLSRRRISGDVVLSTANLATFLSWYRGGAGQAQWHTIVLDSSVNDARFVRFDTESLVYSYLGGGLVRVQMAFLEVGRGLAL